jgi:hypothetical protein
MQSECANHCHERAEDRSEKPFVAGTHGRITFFAPVGGIPIRALVRSLHNLSRVIGVFATGRTTENDGVPFTELNGYGPSRLLDSVRLMRRGETAALQVLL